MLTAPHLTGYNLCPLKTVAAVLRVADYLRRSVMCTMRVSNSTTAHQQ